MKRKVYKGDENIIVYGKIAEAVNKIYDDKGIVEKFEKSPMSSLPAIMEKYKSEVSTILSLSIEGEVSYENVGLVFIKLFTEYYNKFRELEKDDFFEPIAVE